MSKLKCPFCQQKLQYDDLLCSCINEHCEESFDMVGTELLWQKVIDLKQEIDSTRKALDVAVDALKSAHEYYKNCVIREKQPHEINWYYTAKNMYNDIFKALEQITALEQGGDNGSNS